MKIYERVTNGCPNATLGLRSGHDHGGADSGGTRFDRLETDRSGEGLESIGDLDQEHRARRYGSTLQDIGSDSGRIREGGGRIPRAGRYPRRRSWRKA